MEKLSTVHQCRKNHHTSQGSKFCSFSCLGDVVLNTAHGNIHSIPLKYWFTVQKNHEKKLLVFFQLQSFTSESFRRNRRMWGSVQIQKIETCSKWIKTKYVILIHWHSCKILSFVSIRKVHGIHMVHTYKLLYLQLSTVDKINGLQSLLSPAGISRAKYSSGDLNGCNIGVKKKFLGKIKNHTNILFHCHNLPLIWQCTNTKNISFLLKDNQRNKYNSRVHKE